MEEPLGAIPLSVLASTLAAVAVFAGALYLGRARDPVNAPVLRTRGGHPAKDRILGFVEPFFRRFRRQHSPHLWEEVFYSIAFHLRAGETLPQALRAVSEEEAGGPRDSLRKAVRAYEAGAPIMEALQSSSAGGPEMQRLVAAVEIGISTGADLPILLCHSAELLARKRSLRREAKAKLAESRLTAGLLSAMPWFIGVMTYRYDPALMTQALAVPRGRLIVAASLGLWAIGNVAIFLALASVSRERGG